MDTAPPPPPEFARQDLTDAVQVVLQRDGHLLTAGEHVVIQRFLALPAPAASLYARLHSRRPALFRRDQLSYAEVPDLDAAHHALLEAGLALDDRLLPDRLLLALRTVEELKDLARQHGLSPSGRREVLLERLLAADLPRAAAWLPAILPLHRGLFTRLCRLYLHDHSGDLSTLVIARLGHLRFPEYVPTGGLGLFPCRAELRDYEAALAMRWAEPDPAHLIAALPDALARVEGRPVPADHRYRFSARRFAVEQALAAARELERQKEHSEAEAAYRRLLAAGVREAGAVAWRQALCLEKLERGDEAARLCAAHLDTAAPEDALGLERTGRRLARKHQVPWRPLPPLRAAPVREVRLAAADLSGPRPGYARAEGTGAVAVEGALVERLRAAGRRVFFGETAPWSTLLGLLLFDALYAPVPGMLPTPLLHAPLDLGTPGFATRRRVWLEPLLERIAAGDAPAMLREALPRLEGMSVAGVRWDRFTPTHLLELAAGLDGPSLSGVLRCFAEDWRGARRGLPDLCVLPGGAVPLGDVAPVMVPAGLLLVEVKGPGDALRDGQRVWIDRLLRLGVAVELWQVHRIAAG